MPKFQVLRRVDAFVDYVAEVEAVSAEEAAAQASRGETKFAWTKRGIAQLLELRRG